MLHYLIKCNKLFVFQILIRCLFFFFFRQRSSETARSQNNSPNPVVGPNVHRETSDLKLPAPNVQVVIDKMAEYVAKNGPHFEINVRRRGEEKFSFLASNHPHHSYFIFKREWHLTVRSYRHFLYSFSLNLFNYEIVILY